MPPVPHEVDQYATRKRLVSFSNKCHLYNDIADSAETYLLLEVLTPPLSGLLHFDTPNTHFSHIVRQRW
jgi:hypothetical protein